MQPRSQGYPYRMDTQSLQPCYQDAGRLHAFKGIRQLCKHSWKRWSDLNVV